MQQFYIGSLQMDVESSSPLQLQSFDARFLEPVLPITRTNRVQLLHSAQLPRMPEECQIRLTNAWARTEKGVEWRLYDPVEGEPTRLSRMAETGDVDIATTEVVDERFNQTFRPWFYVHLERQLLGNHALILHSASLIYRGEGILFTAPSGTGKSTQVDLWKSFRPDVSDLNGDRTVLQKTERGWYACGFPIFGSSDACVQAAVPIRVIVVVRQAAQDRVQELTEVEKIRLLFSECTVVKAYQEDVLQAMDLVEDLIGQVQVVRLDCTKEIGAAETLHQVLYGEG